MRVVGTRYAAQVRAVSRATALLLVTALGFELAARVEDWIRFRTPLLSPYRSQADLFMRDVDGMHARPGARFRKWIMNNLGTRGPDVSARKPDGVVRVGTIGASETFGLYESLDHEFPRQLERKLQERITAAACPGVVQRVEVLNAASPGMSLPTVTQDVERRLRRFDLDVVIYYPTPAQYLENDNPRPAARSDINERVDLPRTFALYPRLFRRLVDQVKLLMPGWLESWVRQREITRKVHGHPPNWRFQDIPTNRLRGYESDLRRLVAAIRAIGAQPVLATHANALASGAPIDRQRLARWESFYPRATGTTILLFDAAAAEVTRRVAFDLDVALVDVRRIMVGQTDKFADFAHFTDEGAEIVAGAFVPVVMSAIGGAAARSGCSAKQVQATTVGGIIRARASLVVGGVREPEVVWRRSTSQARG